MKHNLDSTTKTLSVEFDGDILSTTQEDIRKSVFELFQSSTISAADWKLLKLDLTKANMIDSAGLNLIVSIIKFVKSRGAQVAAAISSASVHRIFLFTRLDKQMDVTVV